MKKFNVEKSTLKWIVIWFAVCCLSFIAVMAADLSFSGFYSAQNGNKLTSQMWDNVLQKLESMKTEVFSDVQNYMIPSGTIIMYNWADCPNDKWEKWTVDWDVRHENLILQRDDLERFRYYLKICQNIRIMLYEVKEMGH